MSITTTIPTEIITATMSSVLSPSWPWFSSLLTAGAVVAEVISVSFMSKVVFIPVVGMIIVSTRSVVAMIVISASLVVISASLVVISASLVVISAFLVVVSTSVVVISA